MSTSPRLRSRALALGLAVALAWVLWSAWVHRAHFVDDAFISFRYAANSLAGDGLVFNPGERVEGVTNLGWVWLLAGAGAVLPLPLPILAKTLGLLCLAAAVVLTSLAHRRLAPDAPAAERLLLPLLVVSSPELVYFSLAGMETGLAALLLAKGVWFLSLDRPAVPLRLGAAALAAGALFTVRPEAVLLFPVFALARPVLRDSSREPRRRHLLAALAIFAGVVAAVTAFRLSQYGEALPNTFVAKASGGAAAVVRRGAEALRGLHGNLAPPWILPILAPLAGAGAWALWSSPTVDGRSSARPAALFLAATVGTGAAFAVYAPADWTGMGRYFAPYVPCAALLAARGLFGGLGRWAAARGSRPRTASAAATLAMLVLAGVGPWRGRLHLGPRALGEYPGFVLASECLGEPARWIGRHLPAGTTIAARRIGALGYHGRRPVLDYAFGLTDPEVARLRRSRRAGPFESPDAPALAPLWARRPPECLLEDSEVTWRLAVSRGSPWLAVHGVRYREVRRFPLGEGATEWVLACRPGTLSVEGAARAAGGSSRAAGRRRRRPAPRPP